MEAHFWVEGPWLGPTEGEAPGGKANWGLEGEEKEVVFRRAEFIPLLVVCVLFNVLDCGCWW